MFIEFICRMRFAGRARYAPVVKLAYTLGSGPSGRKAVEVQLLSGALKI